MPRRQVITVIAIVIGAALSATPVNPAQTFDHNYLAYARVLSDFLVGHRVDYKRLAKNRGGLDDASEELSAVSAVALNGWTREQRLAYWINAYNLLTLRVIVDHYPIQGSWFSVYPRNSIRQIDGVWDEITWQVGGRTLTLDEIEHRILRPRFNEPLIHFAINCAAVSCPPLRDPDSPRPRKLAATRWQHAVLDSHPGLVQRRFCVKLCRRDRHRTTRRHPGASRAGCGLWTPRSRFADSG